MKHPLVTFCQTLVWLSNDQCAQVLVQPKRSYLGKLWLYKALVCVMYLVMLCYVIADVACCDDLESTFEDLVDTTRDLDGFYGGLIVIGILAASLICFLPNGIPLFFGAFCFARAYGMTEALLRFTPVALAGMLLGSLLTFVAGRTCFARPLSEELDRYPLLTAIQAVEVDNITGLILVRLVPSIPVSTLNLMLGANHMDWVSFLASLLGTIPGTLVVIYFGAAAGASEEDQDHELTDASYAIVWVLGFVLFMIFAGVVVFLAPSELERVLGAEFEDIANGKLSRKDKLRGALTNSVANMTSSKPQTATPEIQFGEHNAQNEEESEHAARLDALTTSHKLETGPKISENSGAPQFTVDTQEPPHAQGGSNLRSVYHRFSDSLPNIIRLRKMVPEQQQEGTTGGGSEREHGAVQRSVSSKKAGEREEEEEEVGSQ